MGEFVELLKEIKDGVDFENCTNLIDGKFLDSFDIIQIVMMIEEEYDVKVYRQTLTARKRFTALCRSL